MPLAAIQVLLVRKALANHLINASILDKKWQLLMLFLKLALSQYTHFSFFRSTYNNALLYLQLNTADKI